MWNYTDQWLNFEKQMDWCVALRVGWVWGWLVTMYTNFVDKAHDDDVHRHTHKNIIAIRYRLTAFVFFVYSGSCMFFGNDSMSIGAVITTTETPTNSSSTTKIQKQAPKDYISQLKNKSPRTNNTPMLISPS